MTDFTGGAWRSLIDGQGVVAIPNSVVSRPDDDGTGGSKTALHGLVVKFANSYGEFGARISNNTSGATRAVVTDSAGNIIDSVDISSLSAGDAFTFSGDFSAETEYHVKVDAEGLAFTVGYNSSATSYPYTSQDVDIVARVTGTTVDQNATHAINDVGNVGFN